MRPSAIFIEALLFLSQIAAAQTIESSRAFAFDRGLVDVTEPYAPTGNPALLHQRSEFRFSAERRHVDDNTYLLSLSYPVSANVGLGLAWSSLHTQEVLLRPAAAFNTSFNRQSFLICMGARGRTNWGQRFEITFEANRSSLLVGPEETPPPFLNDQRIEVSYRLGMYRELTPHFAFGILTTPVVHYRYRTFIDRPAEPAQSNIKFGLEPRTRPWYASVWLPMATLLWRPNLVAAVALSNRSEVGESDAQLGGRLNLPKNLNLTAAVARKPITGDVKFVFGLGAYFKGFDAFAAYEGSNRELRLALSFAPERVKDLIEVKKIELEAPALYPYRLERNDPPRLAKIELRNRTAKPVEVQIRCSGHELPSIKSGVTLEAGAQTEIALPTPVRMRRVPAGRHHYEVVIVAFQRGRQEIKRHFAFEMKDAHDWAGDSRDLSYFIQPHEAEILQTARSVLSGCDGAAKAIKPEEVAKCFYEFLRGAFRYVDDPRPLQARQDRVQYARETLSLKSGDCEDLTILMVSLLESVGVQSAFVEAVPPQQEQGHVFLLFDSQKNAAEVVDRDNLQRYVLRQDALKNARLFIPLELTQLERTYEEARSQALSTYQEFALDKHGLVEGWVKIIDSGR